MGFFMKEELIHVENENQLRELKNLLSCGYVIKSITQINKNNGIIDGFYIGAYRLVSLKDI